MAMAMRRVAGVSGLAARWASAALAKPRAVAAVPEVAVPVRGAVARWSSSSSSSSPLRRIIFFGAPGVGKGTYSVRVAPKLGIPIISTGDLVRAEIKGDTPLGRKIKSFNAAGQLVPDEIIDEMVKVRLGQDDCKSGFMLDGYPRTVSQAKTLSSYQKLDLVINFELPDDVLLTKLLGRRVCDKCGRNYNVADINQGDIVMPPLNPKPSDCATCLGKPPLITRADDNEAVIRNRLAVYNSQTAPVLDFFASKGILKHFPVKKGVEDLPRLLKEMGLA